MLHQFSVQTNQRRHRHFAACVVMCCAVSVDESAKEYGTADKFKGRNALVMNRKRGLIIETEMMRLSGAAEEALRARIQFMNDIKDLLMTRAAQVYSNQ